MKMWLKSTNVRYRQIYTSQEPTSSILNQLYVIAICILNLFLIAIRLIYISKKKIFLKCYSCH